MDTTLFTRGRMREIASGRLDLENMSAILATD
jgi:hypothetical protein